MIRRHRRRRAASSQSSPTLSVCCLTGDLGARVAATLEPFRAVADEIVIAADSRVSDADLAAYGEVADRLLRAEVSYTERHLEWLHAQCSADWIFRIDGDELASDELIQGLPELIQSRRALQYWFARRWLFPDADHWLNELPWYPDFQCRLVRNDGTLRFPGRRHSSAEPLLPRRYVEAPIYHLDLIVNDADTRRQKIDHHAGLRPGLQAPGGGPHDEVFYLPENFARSEPAPVPKAQRSSIDRVLRAGRQQAAAASAAKGRIISLEENDRFWFGRDQPDDGSYRAEIECLERDLWIEPGRTRVIHFRVANTGTAPWPWEPHEPDTAQVRFSYHWLDLATKMVELDGLRNLLPERLAPGTATIVPAMVRAPSAPGSYLLEADLVWHRWFENPSRHQVEVTADAGRSRAGAEDGRRSPDDAYDAAFFSSLEQGALRSATRTLPLVFDLVKPTSVLDVGCGTGEWLSVASELGATEILGIDGDWVPRDALRIPPERFRARDLAADLDVEHRFDLAICLEVAEHLDAGRADSLVRDLCEAAETVLFSAAVPGQTGSDHRNEQWPAYWCERFRRHGYEIVDCVRSRLWADDEVEPWYAQNVFLYTRRSRLKSDPRMRAAARENGRMPLSAVHPGLFQLHSPPRFPPDPAPREQRPAPKQFEAAERLTSTPRRLIDAIRQRR